MSAAHRPRPEYRASFDAAISFSNGGDLAAHGFKVDVPGTEFAIDELTLIGNTATYLDAPYHRYPAVSYTHLDVYKRQLGTPPLSGR